MVLSVRVMGNEMSSVIVLGSSAEKLAETCPGDTASVFSREMICAVAFFRMGGTRRLSSLLSSFRP